MSKRMTTAVAAGATASRASLGAFLCPANGSPDPEQGNCHGCRYREEIEEPVGDGEDHYRRCREHPLHHRGRASGVTPTWPRGCRRVAARPSNRGAQSRVEHHDRASGAAVALAARISLVARHVCRDPALRRRSPERSSCPSAARGADAGPNPEPAAARTNSGQASPSDVL